MRRFAMAFVNRVRRGQFLYALYLTYYYLYLMFYDVRHGTRFANSQKPDETGVPSGGTGNFPAHPKIVQRFLQNSQLERHDRIIDVGHGSGIVLHVAARMGYTNLTGIEYGDIPFALSERNLGGKARLLHGDALQLDLSPYDAVFFFSPFREALAAKFFAALPSNIKLVLAINYDPIIEPILRQSNFRPTYSYAHPIYKNFSGTIWRRE